MGRKRGAAIDRANAASSGARDFFVQARKQAGGWLQPLKGGEEFMPIILTFHWHGFTVTIRIVKRDSRHPDR